MKRIISYIVFFCIGSLFIWFLSWLANRPDLYIDDMQLSFKGVIIEKYNYRGSLHVKINVGDEKPLDIGGLTQILYEKSSEGDSLIKIEKSNCCSLHKDSIAIKLPFKRIPEAVLNRSEYLQDIVNKGCN